MRTIILNSTNIINSDNNVLIYNFPGAGVKFENEYVAISNISIFYSWYNISDELNNRSFIYTWMVNNVLTEFTINIEPGMYEISTINELLQFHFIKNGHYLINENNDYIYYIEMVVNETRYAVQLNTYNFPTSLDTGISIPTNFSGFPSESFNPQIKLSNSNNFNEIIGYAKNYSTALNLNNSYIPPDSNLIVKSNSTISYISEIAPQINENQSILVSISNLDNKYANPTSIIHSITANCRFGEIINENIPQYAFNRIINGNYNNIRLSLLTNKLQPIKINDRNMSFLLIFKNSDEI